MPPRTSILSNSSKPLLFHVERQSFDEITAAERIDNVGNAGFVGDHLLRAQRQQRGLLGRQRVGFVERVGVQRFASPEHGRHRLHGRTNKIDARLPRGQRNTGRLRMETQFQERGFFAPKRSRMTLAQILRAARNLAISSKKSLWASKKKLSAARIDPRQALARRAQRNILDAGAQRIRQLLRGPSRRLRECDSH